IEEIVAEALAPKNDNEIERTLEHRDIPRRLRGLRFIEELHKGRSRSRRRRAGAGTPHNVSLTRERAAECARGRSADGRPTQRVLAASSGLLRARHAAHRSRLPRYSS